MVWMNLSRLFKQFTFILFATALMHSAFAAVEHGKVFPITTTPTSYSIDENSFVDGDASSGVRLVFVAPKAGAFDVKFEMPSSGYYYVDVCPSSTYTSCVYLFLAGTYTSMDTTITASKGDSIFLKVRQYSSTYNTYAINVSYEETSSFIVTFNGKDTAAVYGGSILVNASALLKANEVFVSWKVVSGSGEFTNASASSTYFTPKSNAKIDIEKKTVQVKALSDKNSSLVYNVDGYEKGSMGYAVRTSYKAPDEDNYILVIQSDYSSYVYRYGSDSSFSSSVTILNCYSVCKVPFKSAAGAKNYFELYQNTSYYVGETVKAHVEKAAEIHVDTVGSGYARVGGTTYSFDSSHVAGDTIDIQAVANSGSRFQYWEKDSGKCKVLDSTKSVSKVVLNGDCHLKAVFGQGSVYAITTKAKEYTTADHYFEVSAAYGARFMFVAPSDGAYAVEFKSKDSTDMLNIFRFQTSTFYIQDWNEVTNLKVDAFYLNKNDTVFYLVRNRYYYDSLDVFTVKYSSVASYEVTLTSASAQCSTAVKSDNVVEGARVTFLGYSNPGYRPAGFKVKKGSATFVKDLPNSATLTVNSDITLELQCESSNLIEITTKDTYRSPDNDFYEGNASVGMRYVYVAPTTSTYAIRAKTKMAGSSYFNGYFYDYKGDSTFSSAQSSYVISNTYMSRTVFVTPSSKGDKFYFSVIPSGTEYYDDSVAVYAIKVSVVSVEGKTSPDIVPVGDALSIDATSIVNEGETFVSWKIVSGSGKFEDSTKIATTFTPSSDSVRIAVNKKNGKIYPLTDKFSGFTTYANGSKTPTFYGVRTVYNAATAGTYVLVSESTIPWYVFIYNDSTFAFYSDYSYNTSASTASARNTIRYSFTVSTADTSIYFLLRPYYTDANMKDSIWAKVVKTAKIFSDTVGGGFVRIANTGNPYDSTHIAGDTVALVAQANTDQKFDRWKMVSGSCTVLDSTERSTKLVITGDCRVRAYFKDGVIYSITDTPKSYTTAKDYYVNAPSQGVYFSFQAPSAGTYAIVTSWAGAYSYLTYYRFPNSTFSTYDSYGTSTGTHVDTLTMDAGDKVFVKVLASYAADSLTPFWISYSTAKSILTVSADSNGTASPSQYNPAWVGAKYAINANAFVGFRFDSWELISGTASIDDKRAKSTLISIKKQSEVRAHFKKGSVMPISKTKKTFNYQTHYYSDASGSAVYFTWTPPDTSWYIIQIESTDGMAAKWYDFGSDTTFLSSTGYYSQTPAVVSGTSTQFLFRVKELKQPLYWGLIDASNKILDKNFTIQIVNANVLTVSSEGKGHVNPGGRIGLFPGVDTLVQAAPYGGYVFDKWVVVSGDVKIEDPSSAKTRVKPNSANSEIKATYKLDLATEPELEIRSLDLGSFPGICADVAVSDKNTGNPIAGLDSSDFVLYQDGKALPFQVTSVNGMGAVSVVLVVDESGSMMAGNRLPGARQSLIEFIEGMSPSERISIVGFGNDVGVRQPMTSDRELLLEAARNIYASGNTFINEGTLLGLDQLVDEPYKRVAIIFSDGIGAGSTPTPTVIDRAIEVGATIYSIGIEDAGRDTYPLKDLAEATGGTYTYAPTSDMLGGIYSSIRSEITSSQYTICYQSPDTIMNGDTHEVVIKTKFINKSTSDTAYWSENDMPPVVKLTNNTKKLVGTKQKEGDSLEIKVYVSSEDSIASVIVYTRVSSPNASASYTSHKMTHVKDSLWSYVVPGYNAVAPGVDFYVVATSASGLVGKTPQVPVPSSEPYTIPIGGYAPKIEYMVANCVDTTGGDGELTFTITDADGISSAKLYYKRPNAVVFSQKDMSRTSKKSDDWSVSLTAFEIGDELEFYVRAIDKKGVSARWEKFSNTFVGACSDSDLVVTDVNDTIWIRNGEKDTLEITRLTDKISLVLVTEDFTSQKDTVTASLSCLVSGDVEDNIKLVEVRSGYYRTKESLEKNEYGVKKNDGKISCAATDTLVAIYKDPLYGTFARDSVAIGEDVPLVYQFMDSKCKEDLDSVRTSTSADYCLKIQAPSPSLYVVDTLKLLLFTDQGDTIRVEAIETEDYSKEYVYKGSFYFVEDSSSLKDSLLDAVLDLDTTFNRVVIQGGVTADKSKLRKRDSLVVYTNYVAADFAEIYDLDLDGKADSIRIHFKKPLKKKVASIDTVYWNAAHGPWTNVESSKIRITEDSSWAEARVRKPFKYGLTAIDTAAPPYLRVTKTKSEFSQKTMLRDMIGAVPAKAVKRPGQISMEEYLDASEDVAPDTLVITMSEGITNIGKKTAWKDLFRYSKSCKDTVYSPVRSKSNPIVDSAGLVWMFVLADYAIMKDFCITTNPKATFVDAEGNSMGRGGVEVEGRDETVYLYEVSAVEAVHGSSKKHKKQKWIPHGGDSWEDVPDSLTVIKVASVAPYEANIYIYDNLANVVANMKQKFGYDGEMDSKVRGNDKNRAKIGYLSWNHRSNRDRKVATGVYVWRIDFKFKDGHTEYRILKTGYLRRDE